MMTITNMTEIIFPNTQEETFNTNRTLLKIEVVFCLAVLTFFTTGNVTLSKLSNQALSSV